MEIELTAEQRTFRDHLCAYLGAGSRGDGVEITAVSRLEHIERGGFHGRVYRRRIGV